MLHLCISGTRLGEDDDRELKDVRVYGGIPSRHKDPDTYAAYRRMVAAWSKTGAKAIMRPLRYPEDWPDTPAQQICKQHAVAIRLDAAISRRAVIGEEAAPSIAIDVGVVNEDDHLLRHCGGCYVE
jgi:hypothetical protein